MSEVRLRALGPGVFLPSTLFAIGEGAIAPAIALSARDLGAAVGAAGLVVALKGIGQIVADLPAGTLAARVGERRAMLWSSLLAAVGLATCLLATSVWVLALGIGAVGLSTAVWHLARHAYLAEVVPFHLRARAMSTIGGTQRIGFFIGPFLGAAAMQQFGTDGAYWVFLAAAAAATVALLLAPDVPTGRAAASMASIVRGTAQVFRAHLPLLRTLGLGVLLVGAVRASRQVALPLWGEQIGLDAATTSVVFGFAGALDMLMFYPAGKLMDVVGRAAVAVPSMVVLGLAHLLLPLTGDIATLTAVALLMGVGNGLGSGLIMTIGADVAPPERRPEFLGAWRLCADLGIGAGPLVVSAVTVAAALGPALVVMGGLGCLGAMALARWIPRQALPPATHAP